MVEAISGLMRALLLLLCGCGPLIEADVTVVVPGEIRQQYDRDAAGRVIMQIDHPQIGRTVALGLICESDDADREFFYNAISMGCPRDSGILEAWIEPWSVDDASVTCGPSDELFDDGYDVPRPKEGPYASVRLWTDGGGCDEPVAEVELRLEAPEGWVNTPQTGS